MLGKTLHVPLYKDQQQVGDVSIAIDGVPASIKNTITDAFQFYFSNMPQKDRFQLAVAARNVGSILRTSIPFLEYPSYAQFEKVGEVQRRAAWDRHNTHFTQTRSLYELLDSGRIECHSLSLAMCLSLPQLNPQVYHKAELMIGGLRKKKRHMVCGIEHADSIIILDPAEGPQTDYMKMEQFYVKDPIAFSRDYCGAIILQK